MPRTASVWYYFRQTTYPKIKELWETGDAIAKGAAMMAGVELLPTRVLGTAWPQHFNRAVATLRTPTSRRSACRSGATRTRRSPARCRRSSAVREQGLSTQASRRSCTGPVRDNRGGGSDDIGDISWNVPTITLRYPANIPGLPGPQLGERDRDGDADRAQGHDRRRQGRRR